MLIIVLQNICEIIIPSISIFYDFEYNFFNLPFYNNVYFSYPMLRTLYIVEILVE